MFGRKTGFLAMLLLTMALFGGCADDGRWDEDKARNWYNEMQRNGSVLNDDTPDGYGVYSGGPNWGQTNGNTNRDTYGMRTDNGGNAGTTLGEDIRNAWDNIKDDVKDMGNQGKDNRTK